MSDAIKTFDWPRAIYDLAVDQSTTIEGMLQAADLDPRAGDLSDADLSGLNLSNQDLSGWDLREANMEGTVLVGTRLLGAKIKPINLIRAYGWREAELDEPLRAKALQLEEMLGDSPPFMATLLLKIEDLELSVKSLQALRRDNIVYIGDLIQKSEAELLRTPNFGRMSLNEVKEVLRSLGLQLGMEVSKWPPEDIEELAKVLIAVE